MLLRRTTDIYPKELARDMREFFNSLLANSSEVCRFRRCNWRLGLVQRQRRGFKASLGQAAPGYHATHNKKQR